MWGTYVSERVNHSPCQTVCLFGKGKRLNESLPAMEADHRKTGTQCAFRLKRILRAAAYRFLRPPCGAMSFRLIGHDILYQ